MTILDAVVLGIVEGVTEFLPVSSTGHLIIAASLLGLDGREGGAAGEARKSAVDAFNIVIQGGAILAVLLLYWPRFVGMVRGVLGRDPKGLRLAVNIGIAFVPAAVIGFFLNEWIEERLFHPGPVVAALALGGVFMILVEEHRRGRFGLKGHEAHEMELDELTPLMALVIGLAQCVAMWPGTSRSMMTICAGVLAGMRPRAAAEFSFLLGVPTLGAACVYRLYKDVVSDGPGMVSTLGVAPVVVGFVVAMASAFMAVRWLVGYLNRRGLRTFGYYRLLLALALVGLMLGEVVRF